MYRSEQKNNSNVKDDTRKAVRSLHRNDDTHEHGSTCPSIENNTPYHFTASKI